MDKRLYVDNGITQKLSETNQSEPRTVSHALTSLIRLLLVTALIFWLGGLYEGVLGIVDGYGTYSICAIAIAGIVSATAALFRKSWGLHGLLVVTTILTAACAGFFVSPNIMSEGGSESSSWVSMVFVTGVLAAHVTVLVLLHIYEREWFRAR